LLYVLLCCIASWCSVLYRVAVLRRALAGRPPDLRRTLLAPGSCARSAIALEPRYLGTVVPDTLDAAPGDGQDRVTQCGLPPGAHGAPAAPAGTQWETRRPLVGWPQGALEGVGAAASPAAPGSLPSGGQAEGDRARGAESDARLKQAGAAAGGAAAGAAGGAAAGAEPSAAPGAGWCPHWSPAQRRAVRRLRRYDRRARRRGAAQEAALPHAWCACAAELLRNGVCATLHQSPCSCLLNYAQQLCATRAPRQSRPAGARHGPTAAFFRVWLFRAAHLGRPLVRASDAQRHSKTSTEQVRTVLLGRAGLTPCGRPRSRASVQYVDPVAPPSAGQPGGAAGGAGHGGALAAGEAWLEPRSDDPASLMQGPVSWCAAPRARVRMHAAAPAGWQALSCAVCAPDAWRLGAPAMSEPGCCQACAAASGPHLRTLAQHGRQTRPYRQAGSAGSSPA